MARKALDASSDAPNVISLARARSLQRARRTMFRWPHDGPHPERIAAAALEAIGAEAALVAMDGTLLAVNRRWVLATPACIPGADFYGSWRLGELDPRDAARLITGVRSALGRVEGFKHEFKVRERCWKLTVTPLGGSVGGAVVSVVDHGTRPGTPDGIDPLTGLPDRDAFVQRLTRLLGAGGSHQLGVLVVNLHDFKLVNQAYGHALGDQMLVEVGRRLSTLTGDGELLARLGGDEFALLTRSAPESGDTAELASLVAMRLAEPFRAGTRQVYLNASVGCRVADPEFHGSGIEVLRDAVAALHDAPATDSVAFFSSETRARVVRRMTLENDLRLAVEHGGLRLLFQPQVDARTGAILGAEALVRWQHDEYGSVPPTEFVPIAEASGLIRGLGEWVLAEACRELAEWKAAGAAPALVTVNLSPLQLTDDDLVPLVREILDEHGLTPRELCMELTEGALMSSPDKGIDALRALRALGVSIALDDFGTGHSSLGMLKALPVDVLKLDRSFIVGLSANEQDRAIVAAIMSLADALGLRTVAEGVETHDQASRLLELGCTVVQGWLYAPAVPGDELVAMCRSRFAAVSTAQVAHPRADQGSMHTAQEAPQ